MKKAMKRLLVLSVAMLWMTAGYGKIVKVTTKNGVERVFATTQLGDMEIDSEGEMVVYDYLGEPIEQIDANLSTIEITDEPTVFATEENTWTFADEDLLTKRDVVTLKMLYNSTDPDGQAVTLSGAIHMPKEVWEREKESRGVMLVSHSTVSNRAECPTNRYTRVESMLLAWRTKPEYIIVESDFYGFGSTERYPQAYLFGRTNARATIDALRAARAILRQNGIDCGKRLFNIGYSSGAYDAAMVQRIADEEHPTDIKIDHTMIGGGPMNISLMYDILRDADSTDYAVALPLVAVSYNESAHLGLDYHDIFQKHIADKIEEWILSKEHSTRPLCDSIGTKKLSEIFLPEFLREDNPNNQKLVALMRQHTMVDGWQPDLDDRIFYLHSQSDEVVMHECGEAYVDFLRSKGMTHSTLSAWFPNPQLDVNLQTTFITLLSHEGAAAVFARQVQHIVQAWENKD